VWAAHAVPPRHVQKDGSVTTWVLKDDLIKRGKVYYAKLARGKATFVAADDSFHYDLGCPWERRRG
jgi:hypothetical protein